MFESPQEIIKNFLQLKRDKFDTDFITLPLCRSHSFDHEKCRLKIASRIKSLIKFSGMTLMIYDDVVCMPAYAERYINSWILSPLSRGEEINTSVPPIHQMNRGRERAKIGRTNRSIAEFVALINLN